MCYLPCPVAAMAACEMASLQYLIRARQRRQAACVLQAVCLRRSWLERHGASQCAPGSPETLFTLRYNSHKKASAMMPPTEGRRIYFPEVRRAVWERFPPLPAAVRATARPGVAPRRGERGERRHGNRGLQRHAHHLLPVVLPGGAATADVGCAGAPRLCLCRHGRGRGQRCQHGQARRPGWLLGWTRRLGRRWRNRGRMPPSPNENPALSSSRTA